VGCGKEPLPLKRASGLLRRWHIVFDIVRGRRCSPSRFVDVLMTLFVFDISIVQNSDLLIEKLTYERGNSLAPPTRGCHFLYSHTSVCWVLDALGLKLKLFRFQAFLMTKLLR